LIRSTSKGRPLVGEIQRKEIKKNITDGNKGTLDTYRARAPPKGVPNDSTLMEYEGLSNPLESKILWEMYRK